MASLRIPEHLLEKLERIAQHEQRPVEAVLTDFIEQYPLPPIDEEGMTGSEFAALPLRKKLYEIARQYWRKTGNTDRLALTDEELDEQFWLIDHSGIPRLKSEEGTIELPPNPFEDLIGMFDADIPDVSERIDETVAEYYRKKHGSPD